MSDAVDVLTIATAERRRSPRRRSLLSAQIIFRNCNCSMSGHILNLSEAGAMLEPLEPSLCPNKFFLRSRFDPPRLCEVIWQKGDVLGVRFVSPEGS